MGKLSRGGAALPAGFTGGAGGEGGAHVSERKQAEEHDFCKRRENVRLLCFRGRPGQSLVTETLPEDGEEEGAWERFTEEVLAEDDEGLASSDVYM